MFNFSVTSAGKHYFTERDHLKKKIRYQLLLILLLANPVIIYAQLVGGNVFLQGKYIRLGLTGNAAFGSTVSAPAGFVPPGADIKNIPACNIGRIGFVADPQKDGWSTGTPAYAGEYFLAGAPEEGWAASFNGVNYNNNRSTEYIATIQNYCNEGTQIPGAFTSFQDLLDRQVAEWEGLINGLKIEKRITLPKNKLYFITEITYINTTGVTINDAYYMRNVDPDNEVVPTGSFNTKNKIEYQNPLSGNKALVSARGIKHGSYLGLGTIDCRAKVCMKGGQNLLANRSPADVYNVVAPRQGALGDTITDDVGIAIAFRLGNIAPGDSVRFAFAYILSQADLEEGLSKTAPQFEVNGTTIFTGGGYINCTGGALPINITNGDDYSWVWSPASGLNTTAGSSVIHTSQTAPVTYTVTGYNPICANAKLVLTVYPPNSVISKFITDSACGNKMVTFTNLSPEASYLWDFGDGQTSTETSPVHTYANNGDYQVTLTLTVPNMPTCGNVLISSQIVTVREPPKMAIGYLNDACAGKPVMLQGNATVSGGTIVSHKWTLPGGVIYTTQNISPVFTQPGSYNIIYEAVSDKGCKAAIMKTIVVESIPSASFTVGNGCVDKPLSLTNASSNAAGAIADHIWSLGNNQTVTGAAPSIVYTAGGNYTLQLTVVTGNKCSSSANNPVNVETNPVADFSFSSTCLNLPVNFTNQSTGSITSYAWDFDNGATSTIINPTYTFTSERNYKVSLTAMTGNGCKSSVKTKLITISRTQPNAGKDTMVFKDTPFQLRAKGGTNFLWSPGVFLNNNTIASPVGMLQQDQVFTVQIVDERGCKDSDEVKVIVFDHDDIYVPLGFTPNYDGRNDIFRAIAPTHVIYLFEVYNRWGQKMFSTNDQQKGWDGRSGPLLQPAGVYVWFLKAKTRAGTMIDKKGTVTLIR